jgi:hypothetical protein
MYLPPGQTIDKGNHTERFARTSVTKETERAKNPVDERCEQAECPMNAPHRNVAVWDELRQERDE